MNDAEQPPEGDETVYVGAPTEYADAEEMPDWIQTAAKVVVAVPALLAALSVIELVLLCGGLIIVAAVVLFLLAL